MSNSLAFTDRRQAGKDLGQALQQMDLADPVVLALPRGGVPVGYEVAEAIGAPLDILMVRKIGAPGHKEYGIGAIVDGASPQIVLDRHAISLLRVSDAYIEEEVARELARIESRRAAYRTGPAVSIGGRTAIVVDDGIATGNTAKVALQALAKANPARLILAVPVAPRESIANLRKDCDQIVCLYTPEPFYAVGASYLDFSQTSDEEVVRLLELARTNIGTASSP